MSGDLRPAERPGLADSDFARIAARARDLAGLSIPETKRTMVASRLARRLRATGMRSYGDYFALIDGAGDGAERRQFISALTTNVTHFFREPHHFRLLADTVLPPLVDRARRGGRVRIWSAGCSIGPEPYSIAMTILDAFPEAARLDVRVLATDVDDAALSAASAGIFEPSELRGLDARARRQWFAPADTGTDRALSVVPDLRRMVAFRHLNLVGPWPMTRPFDAIFCRNVVIYFDAGVRAALWPRFEAALAPGGYLFLGHSERLTPGGAAAFTTAGMTAYRKSGAAARPDKEEP